MNTLTEIFGEPIDVYTRTQAIDDGVLCDVTETAREAGITYPVAVTHAVWDGYIVPDPRAIPLGQSVSGRLWDVLSVFRFAARCARGGRPVITFQVKFVMKKAQPRHIRLKAICGPGDDCEPVITIMLPDED